MESTQLIGGFKEKFEKFVYLYKELKIENVQLQQEINKLKQSLKEKDDELVKLKHKLETNDLAKSFVGSSKDRKEAKLKINKIVREIDNCIALLNR